RLEKNGAETVLADNYQGKRLNSPNDLVFKSNGDLYFTDPPFGLPKLFGDPAKEIPYSGVYRVNRTGKITLLTSAIKAPNGIAFSPDEKILYVSDPKENKWFAFDVTADGTLINQRLFFDGSKIGKGKPGGADGLKVDSRGNLFAAAPGGLWIISPDGVLLGRLELGAATGNSAWGEDGSTLFITSSHAVYRIRLNTKSAGW
ncbi:MAG: SMP-30/gluconolactonase/LRE family protein, partial [Acidobacteriales bacterium]|nr:SMP-30/gluconolactonase/LRE family protein [Terriglobales bacterium]